MKTNYAIAVDFDENDAPENAFLLGWNGRDDWYDFDYQLYDVFEKYGKGKLPDTEFGQLKISEDTSLYVGEHIDDVRQYAVDAAKQFIDAVIVKIEFVNGEAEIIPQP